jgi:hypothetical protein
VAITFRIYTTLRKQIYIIGIWFYCMGNVFAITLTLMVILTVGVGAFSSTASASLSSRTFTAMGGTITYEGTFEEEPGDESAASILTVYGGEKIVFFNATNGSVPVIVSGPYTKSGEKYSGEPFKKETLEPGEEWDSEGKTTKGYFEVEDAHGEGGWFEIIKHSFTVELVGKREKVQERKSFNLRLRGNEKEQGVMKLTIEDEEGFSITNANGTDIYEILIVYTETVFADFADVPVKGLQFSEDNTLVFDTSTLDMGEDTYTLVLEDVATEAKDTAEIEVETRYLKVECDEEVVMGCDIVVVITSSFYGEEATVNVEDIPEAEVLQSVILDDEGKKKVKIHTDNLDYGTHRITVDVEDMKETEYVAITRAAVSVKVPENATVGDIVHLKGSSDSGDFAVFVVDDVFKSETRIRDDAFEWDWDTDGEFEGYQEIEVFIVSDQTFYAGGDPISETWQKENGMDASGGIFLLPPTFSMTALESIAEGDDVVLSGKAAGTDHVFVILINQQGEVVFPSNGIVQATPVEDNIWEESIQDLDTGSYVAMALHRGKDGKTDAIENGEWAAGSEAKTLEQRVAILESTLNAAGSDDMFKLAYFSVSPPQVNLDVPATIELDDVLRVKAVTNVKDGEKAFLSLALSLEVIEETSTLVENGSLQANFVTSGLQPGAYNVRVEIIGRASDEKEILLVEKKEQDGDKEKQITLQNESLPEPETTGKKAETAAETNESRGKEKALETPVNVWDVVIAITMATIVSIAATRRFRY